MKVGDKYIVEIAEVQEYHDENGNVFELGRVKGFKALTLDEVALKKLEKVEYVDGAATQDDIAEMRILFTADVETLWNQGRYKEALEKQRMRDRLIDAFIKRQEHE